MRPGRCNEFALVVTLIAILLVLVFGISGIEQGMRGAAEKIFNVLMSP